MFDFGHGPVFVANALGIKQQTAFTYFQQWKQLPPAFQARYAAARRSFRQTSHRDRQTIAGFLARELQTSPEEGLARMSSPWAVKQIASGQWRQWPVEQLPRSTTGAIRKGLLRMQRLAAPRHVKVILDLAVDQEYNPVGNLNRDAWVTAEDMTFITRWISVRAGQDITLTFNNLDDTPHNFALYKTPTDIEPIFRGKKTGKGEIEYRFTAPETPGTYFYRCDDHPDAMKGEFVVTRRRRRPSRQSAPAETGTSPKRSG
jgi:plastocyanin